MVPNSAYVYIFAAKFHFYLGQDEHSLNEITC